MARQMVIILQNSWIKKRREILARGATCSFAMVKGDNTGLGGKLDLEHHIDKIELIPTVLPLHQNHLFN
jgi:hypothetical protein